MADTVLPSPINADPVPKKPRNSRKPLKQASINEANIMAPPTSETCESLSQPLPSPKKSKGKASKGKQAKQAASVAAGDASFEKELQEMQEMLQKLKIEKEKAEEMLKEKDEMLKAKDEELENKGKEQEKLQTELKKLQKVKEFKPSVTFPFVQSLNEKEKDKKKKKGGSERKRPSPPYVLWCKDQWNEVKKENPNAEFKEISNILGAKWKNVTAEEKKPYEEQYQAEKEAYLQVAAKEKREIDAMKLLEEEHKQKTAMELLEQYLQFKQEAEKDIKKTKKEKDPLKPKHPMSAFFMFSNERRAALLAENKNVTEVAKIAGEEWKNMTEKQRMPYEKMAKINKETYLQQMEAYKQKREEEAMDLQKEEEELMKLQKQEALQLLKKKEKTESIIKKTKEQRQKKQRQKQNADPNRPKKPASSFLLFSKEARKTLLLERPGINNSTLTALVSVKWKEMGQEERQIWDAKAAEAMELYKKEIEEYNKLAATSDVKAEKI